MAQPQGLNVPVIMLVGITSCILIATTIEGVRAYYYYTLIHENEAKWKQGAVPLADEVKMAQVKTIKTEGRTPIDAAMKQIVENKGATNLAAPATKPAGQ